VTLFAAAFPLGAMLAFVSNFIELRSDGFKLCFLMRRPRVIRAAGIGIWLQLMQCIGALSVITNCFIFSFSSEQLETFIPRWFTADDDVIDESSTAASATVLDEDALFGNEIKTGFGSHVTTTFFALEHLLLLVMVGIYMLVPSEPSQVRIARRRQKYLEDELFESTNK
jgi:hypothetical protein